MFLAIWKDFVCVDQGSDTSVQRVRKESGCTYKIHTFLELSRLQIQRRRQQDTKRDGRRDRESLLALCVQLADKILGYPGTNVVVTFRSKEGGGVYTVTLTRGINVTK